MKLTFPQLEKLPWTVESGLNINPVPPDSFYPENASDALEIYMGGPKFCGALAACKLPVFAGMLIKFPYVGLDMQVFISEIAMKRMRNCELDVKISVGNKGSNLSSQLALYKGGSMQFADAKGAWQDSGYVPGILPYNTWIPFSYRYKVSPGAYSFLSAAVNGQAPFPFSAAWQNLPVQAWGWGDVIAIQAQPDNNDVASGFMVRYKGELTLSDQPFQ